MSSFYDFVGTSIQLMAGGMMLYGFFKTASKDNYQSMKGFRFMLLAFYMLLSGLLASGLTIIEKLSLRP